MKQFVLLFLIISTNSFSQNIKHITWDDILLDRSIEKLHDILSKSKDYYLKNISTFSNACATRISLSLLHANINVKKEYQIQIGAYKGKGIITSAVNMGNWLKQKTVLGKPDEEIENPKSFNDVSSKIGKRKGIYILISNDFRWASGHATLWHDGNAIGGHNYYEHAKVIYFWELK